MRYLLRVNHNNEYADHHQYAVLGVDRDLARCVLERKRRFRAIVLADSSLCETAYLDCSVEWYDRIDHDELLKRGWMTDEAVQDFEGEGICVISDDVELGEESEGTSYSRMVFRNFGVSWAACSKYTSDEFSTEALSFDLFDEEAGQQPASPISSSPSL